MVVIVVLAWWVTGKTRQWWGWLSSGGDCGACLDGDGEDTIVVCGCGGGGGDRNNQKILPIPLLTFCFKYHHIYAAVCNIIRPTLFSCDRDLLYKYFSHRSLVPFLIPITSIDIIEIASVQSSGLLRRLDTIGLVSHSL